MNESRNMAVLVPMTESEYHAFVEAAVPGYAADKVAAGQWSPEESLALAKKSFDDLLPAGRKTMSNHFFTILNAESVAVGSLWIAVQERAGERVAYVYDVGIKPEHQRRGHATRALLALEEEVRALDLAGIALHVFGHNVGAHALYAGLGYEPTNINMYKPVRHAGAERPARLGSDGLGSVGR
jgi:ribosomal protein S18 acetylase RimI-like enzyme